MNKKEISEIKKLFTAAGCCITRICSCYVDSEKNKRTELKEAFLSLPEEDAFKYFNIFRGTLSGTIEKNLINMDSPSDYLLMLRNSQLKDETLINDFYDKIIESYDYGENYYIVLIHGIYDIPGKASDGLDMFDSSDFVYEFIQCAICSVKLTKGALSYNTDQNVIESRKRDWIVEAPDNGFLFPAFTDRCTDVHGILFYAKKPDLIPDRLVTQLLGCVVPMSAKSQKESFGAIIEEVLGDKLQFSSVKSIYEYLNDLLEESKDMAEPLALDKYQVKKLLENSGASDENLADFEKRYQNMETPVSNVINSKAFEIETEGLFIKVKPDLAGRVECRMIEGRPCIVMAVSDHLKVDGIEVRPVILEREGENK